MNYFILYLFLLYNKYIYTYNDIKNTHCEDALQANRKNNNEKIND